MSNWHLIQHNPYGKITSTRQVYFSQKRQNPVCNYHIYELNLTKLSKGIIKKGINVAFM